MRRKRKCPDCGHTDVRPEDGRHDALTCLQHVLEQKRDALTCLRRVRKLKAEWWELWWVKPGAKPVLIVPDGEPIPPWIPQHGFPTRHGAEIVKAMRRNRYDKIIHVRRFVTLR